MRTYWDFMALAQSLPQGADIVDVTDEEACQLIWTLDHNKKDVDYPKQVEYFRQGGAVLCGRRLLPVGFTERSAVQHAYESSKSLLMQ